MMTKGEVKELMLRWLDEATVNGERTAQDQIADFLDRADHLLDGVVKFLAGQFKLRATHTVVRAPVKNLLGENFKLFSVVPPDAFSCTSPCQSYYLEVCGNCTITLRTGDTETIITSVSSPERFEIIKGMVPEDVAGDVTIKVTSAYPFVVRNAAMYPCRFIDNESVPDYVPYVPYELPEDFREFDRIILTGGSQRRKFTDFRKEGIRTYLLPYYSSGQFEFFYFRNPLPIPPDAPEDTVIEIEDHAAQLVPLKLAVDCCMGVDELQSAAHALDSRFDAMLVNLLVDDRGDKMRIDTVFSMM